MQDQINELGTNILVVSPGSSTSTTGTRGGFGSASTLTQQDADALAAPAAAPDVQAVAPTSTTSASLVRRLDQLDHDPDRDHAELVGGALARCHLGPVPLRRRPDERRGGGRARPRHRAGAVRGGQPDRSDGGGQRSAPRGDRRAHAAQLLRADIEQRPRDRAAVDLHAEARRRCEPQLGELDLREGDVVRRAVGRVPGDERAAPEHAQGHQPGQRRLLDRHPAVDPRRIDIGRRHAHRDARPASR